MQRRQPRGGAGASSSCDQLDERLPCLECAALHRHRMVGQRVQKNLLTLQLAKELAVPT
jgi:hypothetical protein